ncbi:unnamed protein product, partial [Mesorhabditis spiculigera]
MHLELSSTAFFFIDVYLFHLGLTYGLMGELNAYNWYRPSVLLGGIQDNVTRVVGLSNTISKLSEFFER